MASLFAFCGGTGQMARKWLRKSGQWQQCLKELAHGVLRRLLQRGASEPGEAKVAGKVLGDFPHETMEGSLADQ
jgi:hypothetical protein